MTDAQWIKAMQAALRPMGIAVLWLMSGHGAACTPVAAHAARRSAPVSERTDSLPADSTSAGAALQEVQVVSRRGGTVHSRGLLNTTLITEAELTRAACCNLGESFTTNPSVDVSYSDATTGARQIKLLGLSGSYVQLLAENVPVFRGAAAPYALSYVPGPWMQSIQVSKGCASVKNGYESITGQINVEYRKPQSTETMNANVYGDSKTRMEANADANFHLGGRWSTGILAHYENNPSVHDENADGFADRPRVEQVNLQARWARIGPRYLFQALASALDETRESGQMMHEGVATAQASHAPFLVRQHTEHYEGFAKNAYIYDSENNGSVALILSAALHDTEAGYGRKYYNVEQTHAYASLLWESDFGRLHNFSAGLSLNADNYRQHYRSTHDETDAPVRACEQEAVPGAYAQYTLNWNDNVVAMAGVRVDRSNRYGAFVTPRMHLKWAPAAWGSLRFSAGKGYRSVHPLAEYHYLMAAGRRLVAERPEQEEARNVGAGWTLELPFGRRSLHLSAEYYYTDFLHQVLVDYETNADEIRLVNLKGRSYAHTLQGEASCEPFDGLSLTAAYRWNEARSTYNGVLMRRPLTPRYKALLTVSYATPLGLWQVDATLQMNGSGRLPTPYVRDDGAPAWEAHFPAYEQLGVQVTRRFRQGSVYVGGENLTGFRQKQILVGADDPWGARFDPTLVWGPVHGAVIYAGIRLRLERPFRWTDEEETVN